MASEKTVLKVFALLKAAFPDWARNQDTGQEKASTDLYLSRLRDVPDDALKATALAWIDHERFFPRVADLKAPILRLQKTQYVGPDEAWQQCLAGSVPANSMAKRVFQNLGLNRHDLGKMSHESAGVYQSQFLRAYRDAMAKEHEDAKLPQELREALPAPSVAPTLEDAATVAKREKKAQEEAAYHKWFARMAKNAESKRVSGGKTAGVKKQNPKSKVSVSAQLPAEPNITESPSVEKQIRIEERRKKLQAQASQLAAQEG